MKTKSIILLIFLFVVAAQLAVPVSMILDQEDILDNGKTLKFRVTQFDPTDPFRGKYITLNYIDDSYEFPDSLYFHYGQDVFVILEKDSEGYSVIIDVASTKPTSETDYLEAKIDRVMTHNDSTKVYVKYPFTRFYMEENKAPEAEKAFMDFDTDSDNEAWAIIKVKEGKGVLENVMMNGIPIATIAKRRLESEPVK